MLLYIVVHPPYPSPFSKVEGFLSQDMIPYAFHLTLLF